MTHSKKKRRINLIYISLLIVVAVAAAFFIYRNRSSGLIGNVDISHITYPDWIDSQVIAVNGGARRGQPLEAVRNIAIHYVGNPNTTAQQNHDYFGSPDTSVSSHFLVGLEGEVIQCVPLNEKSSATNDRNKDTISIEVCHPDKSGKFTPTTYSALVKLSAWVCQQFDLNSDQLIRHYDVTGKSCPLYFVENEDAWVQFKADVATALQ